MSFPILTTAYTERELKDMHTYVFSYAKDQCANKITFHQNEINTGHCSQYHIDQLELYMNEFRKWVQIVIDAKERDRKNDESFFYQADQD